MFESENSFKPIIIDFGLATNADLDSYIFKDCGTPGYMAP
jgi:serine/threonine protein kinase